MSKEKLLPNGYIKVKQSWEKVHHYKVGVSERTKEYAPVYLNISDSASFIISNTSFKSFSQ